MSYLKYVFVILLVLQPLKKYAVVHKNIGLNYHQIYYSSATSLNYNFRWNVLGKNNWNGALAINPHFGALFLNNPTPFVLIPLNFEYHSGMGANFDVLKYRGYSYRVGACTYNSSLFPSSINLNDIKNSINYGALIGGDYKFQTTQLKTFSFQWNIIYSIPFGIHQSLIQIGLNYHFGYY